MMWRVLLEEGGGRLEKARSPAGAEDEISTSATRRTCVLVLKSRGCVEGAQEAWTLVWSAWRRWGAFFEIFSCLSFASGS